jgi:hypothetical protein
MNTTPTLLFVPRRELAHRANSGLEVTLFWDARDDSTTIEIHHADSAETIAFPVPAERALDAFYHPFAHLAELEAA